MFNILIAAFLQGGGVVFSRIGLVGQKIDSRHYMTGSFIYLSAFCIAGYAGIGMFEGYRLVVSDSQLPYLIGIVAAAAISHLFYMYGVRHRTVTALENVVIVSPLLTILFAYGSGIDQPSVVVIVGAFLATGILLWADKDSGRPFRLERGTWLMMASVLFSSVESVFVAEVLGMEGLSPMALYTIRTLLVAGLLMLLFPIKFSKMKPGNRLFLLSASLFGFITMVLKFYSLRDLGVVRTSIVLMLVPVVVYGLNALFLKKKISHRRRLAIIGVGGISLALLGYESSGMLIGLK